MKSLEDIVGEIDNIVVETGLSGPYFAAVFATFISLHAERDNDFRKNHLDNFLKALSEYKEMEQ